MTGRPIIITGGGRGIGAATARLAAARGYAVCINYLRDGKAAADLAGEIQADGGQAFAYKADMASRKEVADLFEAADERFGPPAALVNNAADSAKRSRLR